jgi:hypothetical protein
MKCGANTVIASHKYTTAGHEKLTAHCKHHRNLTKRESNLTFMRGKCIEEFQAQYISMICLRNLGAERINNSETVSLRERNSKENIWAHERKSNMEN